MKPSSVLKYSGWGIVDSPSESPWQTADFFFLSESVSTFSRLICTLYMATIIMVCCSCML